MMMIHDDEKENQNMDLQYIVDENIYGKVVNGVKVYSTAAK
jgi:hypothetical protein